MAATGDGDALRSIAEALGTIPEFLDVSTAIELLKYPLSVGPVRASLLRSLERASGLEAGRGLWPVVEEESRIGITPADLRRPPVRPSH